jgi:PadR family transcriptional regulator PadR
LKKGKSDLLHGTLDLLILKTLASESMHGWAISRHIQQLSGEVLEVGQGSIYPALYRLEDREWIASEWGVAESGRRAKFYFLTRRGTKHLAMEEAQWQSFSMAVNRVLDTA